MRYVSSVLSAFVILTSFLFSGLALGYTPPTPASFSLSNGGAYDFGAVTVGASKFFTFTVTNTGQAAAKQLEAIVPASPFSFRGGAYPGKGGNCGKTLAGNGRTCRVVLEFKPTAAGSFSGSFGIQYTDRYGAPAIVTGTVTGVGATPASLSVPGVTSYNFGSVTNGTSKVHAFTITNSGSTAGTQLSPIRNLGAGFSFEGGYPGVGGTCNTTLLPSTSCTVKVTYTPTKRATDTGKLTINYQSGSGLSSFTVALSGRGKGTAANITSVSPSNGPSTGGTFITVTGANFVNPFTLTIGGVLCTSAVLVSSTKITCTTGPHAAGPVDVVLTDTAVDTFNNGFTYDGAPELTSINPEVDISAGGSLLSIVGSNFQSSVTVTIGGQPCLNTQFGSETFLQCTVPPHPSGQVSITVTNPDGQGATLVDAFSYKPSWTWVGGNSTADSATTGAGPGGRDSAASWTDSSNHFWIFGGWGQDASGRACQLNDLWKYNGATWTLMAGNMACNERGVYGTVGVPDALNHPGSRMSAMMWRDSNDHLWLFGGFGFDSNGANGILNDLWKFDGTNWCWISGSNLRNQRGMYGTMGTTASSSMPGGRVSAVQWIDSQERLWLFGGYGTDSAGLQGDLNDLWVFEGGDWTWMGGTSLRNQRGIYGTLGVSDSTNIPGARDSSIGWKDSSGNFWIFGGVGRDTTGVGGQLGDLWKFDGSDWTWMSGANTANPLGTYGSQGIASVSNIPSGRSGAISWFDSSNNLWIFGGYGRDGLGFAGGLSDLWKFDGIQWTWVSGSQTSDNSGVFGTQGLQGLDNSPGAIQYPSAFIDSSDRLWLFGGFGPDQTGLEGDLNTLWKYEQ